MQSPKPFPKIDLKRWKEELGLDPWMSLHPDRMDLEQIGRALDRTLAREGWVVMEDSARLLRGRDLAESQRYSSPENRYRFTATRDLIESNVEHAGYLFRLGTDADLMGYARRNPEILVQGSLSDLWEPAPASLLEVQVRKLFVQKFFGHDEWRRIKRRRPSLPIPKHFAGQFPIGHLEKWRIFDGKLEMSAFLVTRHLNRPDLVERYAPALRYEDFHRYQAQVLGAARRRMPLIHQRFDHAWMRLTQAQRDALQLVYMRRDLGETQADIAKRLQIGLGSLKKRVSGAAKKLSQALDRPLIPRRHKRVLKEKLMPPIYRIHLSGEGFETAPPTSPLPLPDPELETMKRKLLAARHFARVTCARFERDETSFALPHPWQGRKKGATRSGVAGRTPYEAWKAAHRKPLEQIRKDIEAQRPRIRDAREFKYPPPEGNPRELRENRQSYLGQTLLALPPMRTAEECEHALRPPPRPATRVLEDE